MNWQKKFHLIPLFVIAVFVWLNGFGLAGSEGDLAHATCETDRMLYLTHPVMTGDDVAELQKGLRSYGFYHGPINGRFEESTAQAVCNFQKKAGLSVDGRVGVETWKALAATFLYPAVSHTKPPKGEVSIVIDISKRQLRVYDDGQLHKTYPVAIGKSRTPSPIGEWKIVHKSKNWGGGFGTRWLGLNVPWGIYGIHGTNKPWSIGGAESAGCFRMYNHQVEELYRWVKVGTFVRVVGPVDPDFPKRTLRRGHSGQDVVFLQLALRNMGFDAGAADARFGPDTEEAIKRLQAFYGLPVDGIAGPDTYYLLEVK